MKLNPRVTRTGVELVKRFEGLRRRAARLPDGGWTIGYGHTASAREGAEVSPEDAEALLYYDLSEVAGKLEAWTFTPLNQNQFEALSAFAFNIGLENFRNSTVLKRVNEGHHLLAGAAMELWRKADFNGEDLVVDALVRRRAAEKAHYLTPPEGFRPAPSPVLRPTFDHSVIEAAAQAQAARHATVVDVPLDGDTAIAVVQQPSEADHEAPARAVSTPASPVPADVEQSPLMLTPPYDAAISEPPLSLAPSNDGHELSAPTFPVASSSAALAADAVESGFRGFEPPPRRFERQDSNANIAPSEPANEGLASFESPAPADPLPTAVAAAVPEIGAPNAADWTSGKAETPDEGTLFDQPLAPPPPAAPLQAARSMRLTADGETEAEGVQAQSTFANGVQSSPAHGLLRNRVLFYGSIGVLGVFLFSIAVANMAFGKASSATLATLLMGILGIVLMTPAGVWFLMHRLNAPERDAHA